MIKLQPRSYFNFRCGEILCVGPLSYTVCCALCGQRVPYDEFPQHFRLLHLTETETETEDCKLIDSQAEERHLDAPVESEIITGKSETDPIAHDDPNGQNDRVHVDLAQIAQFDQETHETDRDVDITDASHDMDNTSTIALRPQRRAAALNNILVREIRNTSEEPEAVADEMIRDGSSDDARVPIDEYSAAEDKDCIDDDTRDMLFQCDQCDRAYNSNRSLQSHKRSKHNVRKPVKQLRSAAETISTGASLATLVSHKKARKGPAQIFKCDENGCNQTFRTERDLRGHRWKHTGIYCDICGKPFTQSGNMMRHRQRHSGIKPYKCQEPDCDATFYTQKELTSHNICHTGRMPCICEVCGRPCRDRGVLTAHMRRHTGERPAKCEVCGKAFYSFHDLNVHAVSHTNLRPFVCDICGSTFQRKKALRVHKLLHSEQRKYSCKLCGKTFAQSGGLNAHMRTHESSRGTTKTKTTVDTTASMHITTPDTIEAISSEEVLESEAVTIELIQEDHASHVEVVAIATAGSWHMA